jgi:ubiquinone/menaquinone biosynthesis C-methylase UbiE
VTRVREREAAHHDRFAAALDPASMPPTEPDRLERMLLDAIGPVSGLRVLELGCGHGDLTLQLLERGANVVAIDISPGMVDVTRERAKRFRPGADLEARAAPVEDSGVEAASVDLVTGKWILHHVDLAGAAREVHRVLRPGGRGVFFENHALNPLLSAGRKHLVGRLGVRRFGTEDEHPLTRADYALWSSTFSSVELEYPDFHFFGLLTRQLFTRRPRMRKAGLRLDDLLWRRLPAVRPYGYHVIVRVKR